MLSRFTASEPAASEREREGEREERERERGKESESERQNVITGEAQMIWAVNNSVTREQPHDFVEPRPVGGIGCFGCASSICNWMQLA